MEYSKSGPRRSSRNKDDYPSRASEVKRTLLDTGIIPDDELYEKKRRS